MALVIHVPITVGIQINQYLNSHVIWLNGKNNKVKIKLFLKRLYLYQNNSIYATKTLLDRLQKTYYIRSQSWVKSEQMAEKTVCNQIHMLLLSMNTRYSGFMRVRGVGYKFDMKNPNTLELDVGCSKKIEVKKPASLGLSFSKKNTKIQVKGFTVKEVTLFLSKLRKLRVPEVYKGKGIRYLKDPVKLKIGKIKK